MHQRRFACVSPLTLCITPMRPASTGPVLIRWATLVVLGTSRAIGYLFAGPDQVKISFQLARQFSGFAYEKFMRNCRPVGRQRFCAL